jgi:Ca2+-transporting ATPase
VFEAEHEERNVMQRPPRPARAPLIGRALIVASMARGALILAATLGVLALALVTGRTDAEARTLTFVTLVLADLGLILSSRSASRTAFASLGSRNAALWTVTSGTLVLLAFVLAVPALRDLFRFAAPRANDYALVFGAALLTVLLSDVLKMGVGRRSASRG